MAMKNNYLTEGAELLKKLYTEAHNMLEKSRLSVERMRTILNKKG
jgi:hypothetical protein